MKAIRYIIFSILALSFFACSDDEYVANVTELKLVRMSPTTGYSGAIVKILGRNFSSTPSANIVTIGEKTAKVLDADKWELTIVLPTQDPGNYEVKVQTPSAEQGGLSFQYKEKPEHTYLTSIYAGVAGSNSSEDGLGSSARLSSPEGIVPAGHGEYYILQRGTFAVRKMDTSGKITTLSTTGAPLNFPWQGALGPSGDLYFCNKGAHQLLKMNSKGVVSIVSGFSLKNPMGLKFDTDGNGYLANRNYVSNDIEGQVIKFKDDAVVTTYSVQTATCVAVDGKGRVVVGSNNAGYLFMIDKDGSVSKIAGEGNLKGSAGDGTPGDLLDKSTIGFVNGICCASDGSIYFCDVTALSVRKLTPDKSGNYAKGKIETISSGYYPSDVVVSEDLTKIFVTSATTQTIRLIEVI
ncbi:MAG: IPT/TIG domain-containing protein [Bacteroidales bacterium]